MTAQEIRDVTIAQNKYGEQLPMAVEEFRTAMLREIAAQLAEQNELLRKQVEYNTTRHILKLGK